jgi:DNA-binding LytR/AlgR family response regulator
MENYSAHNLGMNEENTAGSTVIAKMERIHKTSFLILKNSRYVIVRTENIAFFQIKFEASMIVCFDRQEYFVNYSLDQLQGLLPAQQFFRVNRQCLINFQAIQDVELYFARKLLVNPVIPAADKLLIRKEKVSIFLHWLDNR